jgi:hypothetical protein
MTSARTSLGEVRTRRRSRRAAGPSASARRVASSQNTGARAYQRVRLDGDEMPADADDGDAGHFSRTYMGGAVTPVMFQRSYIILSIATMWLCPR